MLVILLRLVIRAAQVVCKIVPHKRLRAKAEPDVRSCVDDPLGQVAGSPQIAGNLAERVLAVVRDIAGLVQEPVGNVVLTVHLIQGDPLRLRLKGRSLVAVPVERDEFGIQRNRILYGVREILVGLIQEPVHQIDVQPAKAGGPDIVHGFFVNRF